MFLPASHFPSESIPWLWPGRLALGKLSLLEGDPGLGKSWVACDLAARLSVGLPFPDGSPGPGPAHVLFVSAEDSPSDTLRPRLAALGADLARVLLAPLDSDAPPLLIPSQMSSLANAFARYPIRLLILDPLIAFLSPSVSLAADASIRRALHPLARLAHAHRCAVLLLRHLNKQSSSRSLYRGSGSIGLLAACRSAFLLARSPVGQVSNLPPTSSPLTPAPTFPNPNPNPAPTPTLLPTPTPPLNLNPSLPLQNDPPTLILAHLKNNLAPLQPSLAFTLLPPLTTDHQPLTTPPIVWLGPSPLTADQLLHPRPRPSRPRDRARSFLLEILKNGPQLLPHIRAAARRRAIAPRTLARARHDLKVRSLRALLAGQPLTYWLLENQSLPAHIPPDSILPSWSHSPPPDPKKS